MRQVVVQYTYAMLFTMTFVAVIHDAIAADECQALSMDMCKQTPSCGLCLNKHVS